MFLVSGLELVAAVCREGMIGAFPGSNARDPETLDSWLGEIARRGAAASGRPAGPAAVNMVVGGKTYHDRQAWLEVLGKHRTQVVITSVGDPAEIVAAVHDWGGLVFHDVTNLRHAEKAARAGVDGMIAICAGAGGHSGSASPFALVPQLRRNFSGLLAVGGGIGDGAGIAAAQTLGADLAYVGTRFIASDEAIAEDNYKQMITACGTADILYTDAISGLSANFMRPSIVAAGLDPDRLPPPLGLHRPNLPEGVKSWKHIWSAGHGVGFATRVQPVHEIAAELRAQFDEARAAFRDRIGPGPNRAAWTPSQG
jgi:nitronate monooxygenase